jgi:hypothetical protein
LDNPDSSTVWPQTFEVDYVHAYERNAQPRELSFDNGGFEQNNGSLASWTKFGDSINNVSSGNEKIADGNEALKLYGQFNNQTNYSGITQGLTVLGGDELTASVKSLIASNDSLSGSDNAVFFKIDYFNTQHGLFGSDEYVGSDSITIGNAQTTNDQWLDWELNSIVPADAVEARIAVVFEQKDNAGGSIFVDDIQFAIDNDILGDFDNDGDVDADDVDFFSTLLRQPASVDPRLDLNSDGLITLADHDFHIENLALTPAGGPTLVGDLNFDGIVDVLSDASRLVNNLNRTSGVGYADGDLDADGRIDVLTDAARLLNNLGQSASASVATSAVPEPSSGLVLGWLLAMAGLSRAKRTQ